MVEELGDGKVRLHDEVSSVTVSTSGPAPVTDGDDAHEEVPDTAHEEPEEEDPAEVERRRGGSQTKIEDDHGDDTTTTCAPAPVVPGAIVGTAAGGALFGEASADRIMAMNGRDMIFAGDGDDTVFAGGGADVVFGDGGERPHVRRGRRRLSSRPAPVTTSWSAATGDDRFAATVGDGDDVYYGDDISGGTGSDTLDMSRILSDITVDLGSGSLGRGSCAKRADWQRRAVERRELHRRGGRRHDHRRARREPSRRRRRKRHLPLPRRRGCRRRHHRQLRAGRPHRPVADRRERRGGRERELHAGLGRLHAAPASSSSATRRARTATTRCVEGNISGDEAPEFSLSIRGRRDLGEDSFSL